MRVLFTCRPLDGHYYPMRPLMAALVGAGDDVAVATGQPLLASAQAEGFVGFKAGLDNDDPTVVHHRKILGGLPAEEIRRYAYTDFFVRAELPPREADLQTAFESFEPDLVVHETAELAGPLVATVQRVPYASHSYGVLLRPEVAALAGAAAAPYWRARGLEPHPLAGLYEHLYLDICPPTLQIPAIRAVKSVQAIGQTKGAASLSDIPWLERLSDRPIVYVSLGTVYNRNAAVFQTLLAGLRGEDLNVVVTVGRDNDPSMLGPQPANVVVHRFVPQAQLLPHCSAVVTHGGAGSVLGALRFGLPVLVVPQGADHFYNAERIAAAGAGASLPPADLTPAAVRSAVRELLDNPMHREAAQRVRAEFDAMPEPADIRPRLLELALLR